MERTMSEEDMLRILHHKYEMPEEEAKRYLDSGVRYRDLEKAALFACLARVSIDRVLELRKENPWGRVKKLLLFTPDSYEASHIMYLAKRLERFYGVRMSRALSLLNMGYPSHWIRMAHLLEKHTHVPMEEIVRMKKKSVKWRPFAQEAFGIDPEDLSRWILETRNPALPPKKPK